MLSNMAGSLIEHKRVMTTVQKAKALRKVIEPLVTRSKENTTHNRRIAFAVLRQKEVVTELFNVVGPKVGDRPGGYTRIIKTGNRQGDNAEMCMIELVDFNDMYGKDEKKKTTRRSRRAKTETAPVVEEAAPVAEAPAAVEESKEESAE
jgi:large subunit ribosomal protein L17